MADEVPLLNPPSTTLRAMWKKLEQDSSLQQRRRVFLQTLKSNTKKVFLRIAWVFLQGYEEAL